MSLTLQTQNGPLVLTLDGAPRRGRRYSAPIAAPAPVEAPVARPTWADPEADLAHLPGARLVDVDGTTNLAMVIWRPESQLFAWRVQGDPVVYWSVTLPAAKAAINQRLGLPGGEHFGW